MTTPRRPSHNPFKPVRTLFLATSCWGLSFPLMKGLWLSQHHLAPAASVWFITAQTLVIRFGLAAVLMALFLNRRMWPIPWLDLKLGAGLGFLFGVGPPFSKAGLGQNACDRVLGG